MRTYRVIKSFGANGYASPEAMIRAMSRIKGLAGSCIVSAQCSRNGLTFRTDLGSNLSCIAQADGLTWMLAEANPEFEFTIPASESDDTVNILWTRGDQTIWHPHESLGQCVGATIVAATVSDGQLYVTFQHGVLSVSAMCVSDELGAVNNVLFWWFA